MSTNSRMTVPKVLAAKSKRKLAALTAYDYTMARLVDAAGTDIILVGDSLGTVCQGADNTLGVTMDQMVYHSQCVAKAVLRALVVADLPFMSYQVSPEQALISAGRLIKEGGASAVKLEGPFVDAIEKIVAADIPVMGHVGLTPQSFHRMGGHKIQGKRKAATKALQAGDPECILEAAHEIQEAGAFALVIEGVPPELARRITNELSIPTIGIAAGSECDGQILVTNDLLGLNVADAPAFVEPLLELEPQIVLALQTYAEQVRTQDSKTPKKTTQIVLESELN